MGKKEVMAEDREKYPSLIFPEWELKLLGYLNRTEPMLGRHTFGGGRVYHLDLEHPGSGFYVSYWRHAGGDGPIEYMVNWLPHLYTADSLRGNLGKLGDAPLTEEIRGWLDSMEMVVW